MPQADSLQKNIAAFLNSNLSTQMGCELEFFLLDKDGTAITDKEKLESFIQTLTKLLITNLSLFHQVEKEQGVSQIEIKSLPTTHFELLCHEINSAKSLIHKLAKNQNLVASFAAQPFDNDCGNALQFSLSNCDPVFIAALLKYSKQSLDILAPTKADHLRYDLSLNRALHQAGKYVAPTFLCYGKNNRTAAIRVLKDRIEYRIACANADPKKVISFMLWAIKKGVEEGLELDKKSEIYGNAFDEQYELEEINVPSSYQQY